MTMHGDVVANVAGDWEDGMTVTWAIYRLPRGPIVGHHADRLQATMWQPKFGQNMVKSHNWCYEGLISRPHQT